MKKICSITTIDMTHSSFMVPTLLKMKEQGYDITIICSMSNEFEEKYSKDFNCINLQMERGANFVNMIKSIIEIYKILKKGQFDFVQYSTPNAAFYASIAGVFAKIPKRIYCQWGIRYVGFDSSKKYLFKCIEKITCLLSTHIRPVSRKNMEFAIREGLYKPQKAEVIGEGGTIGIDINEFDISLKAKYKKEILSLFPQLKNKFVFGFIGRIAVDKGVIELLRAFQRINREYPNVALLIVGGEDKTNAMLEIERNLARNNPNVIFAGFTNEVVKYISIFDVHLHPSYREGFSMVIQQTMAMEIPVITTDIPGPSEVIEEDITGVLVQPKDEDDLFNKMCSFLDKPYFELEAMGKAGRKRVLDKFLRKNMIQAILEDRNRILKEKNSYL